MAEEKSNMMTMVLVGLGAYLLYEWWQGASGPATAPAVTPVGGNPVLNTITTGTPPHSNIQNPPPPPPPPVPQTTTLRQMIAASNNPNLINDPNFSTYIAGHAVGPDMQLGISQATALLSGYVPQAPPQQTGNIAGFTYTTKATYLQALMNAVFAASGGSHSQTADEWNWIMTNSVGVPLSPSPDGVMQTLGLQRNDALSSTQYYQALDAAGLIPYPSGLQGLAAAARGMQAKVGHPLRPGHKFGRSF